MNIYLDNNATTGVDPKVVEAMLQDLSSTPANPSSIHSFGKTARNRLLKARQTIAAYFHVKPQEIIFTSGGTEALNMILRGLPRGHILTTDVEHSAVFNTVKWLETQGSSATYLSVGKWGAATPEQVEAALTPKTNLITLTAANNETGVKTDIPAIARLAKEARIPFVVDGVCLLGKDPFAIEEGVSAMAFSAHKIHGPKGVGFTFVRSSLKWQPLLTGGDQEYGKRAGSENMSGILGLAAAIKLLKEQLPAATERMRRLRDKLERGLQEKIGQVRINGSGPRLCNTSNLSFLGVDGETLLISLDLMGIATSHGSACSSGALEPSRILQNMGLSREEARASLRFSLSRWTTEEEIEKAIELISDFILKLR